MENLLQILESITEGMTPIMQDKSQVDEPRREWDKIDTRRD
jgi:hypothetical protein